MPTGSAKNLSVRPFHFVSTTRLDQKFVEWKKSFTKLHVEIGCGVGLHPIQWTAAHPGNGLLALERTQTKFQSFQRRINNHERSNLYAVHADAHDWLPRHITSESIDGLFLMYPNPYPKERQANKRWYRSPFCHFLMEILKPGGQVQFATNEKFLVEEALSFASEVWALQLIQERKSTNAQWLPRTHFEKKYMARGQTCYDLTFRKTR
jgi:tRNA (guanine-N(7)-)-methyltransferase